jgi:hypothetical protein
MAKNWINPPIKDGKKGVKNYVLSEYKATSSGRPTTQFTLPGLWDLSLMMIISSLRLFNLFGPVQTRTVGKTIEQYRSPHFGRGGKNDIPGVIWPFVRHDQYTCMEI